MNEIVCPEQDTPFGGISVLVCGVLYQLPRVRAKPVFTINETESMEAFISIDLLAKVQVSRT